ncbi:nucleosome assembly protein 1;3-like isoform X2 [Silene latifolia]|uniref:nucleosome assembly protein 1;3-like isoform X2 n=1 Tax=Silene latifolia TaxID=37657 RepID=UPI003D78A7BC
MDNSDFLEKKSPIEHPLELLKQIQSDLDDIEATHFGKRITLENKYQKKFQPFYTKRYEIVNSSLKLMLKSSYIPPQEIGVPNFWLIAMKSNEAVAELIQKHDEDALRYLKDIKWCRIQVTDDMYPDPKATEGFKLEFVFDSNPYFRNSVLSKTYCMYDEDNDIIEKVIGTPIEWFPGKCLTNKVLSMSKSSIGMTRTILDSFFNFFNPIEVTEDADAERVESLMQPDYSAALSLRDVIIPHAVYWFTEGNSDNESGAKIGDITNSQKNAKVEKLSHTILQNVKLLEQIQRYEIVNGIKPGDQAELKAGKEKRVPNFWLTALKANKTVGKMIQLEDEEILKYLKDIRWDLVTRGFKLEFDFNQNTYFRNALLTVSYFVIDEFFPAPSLEETIGTEIEWLVKRRLTTADSFFNIFTRPTSLDCKDSEKAEEWRSRMELDYAIGLKIWKDVIPHAVSLFTTTGEFEDRIGGG